MKIRIMQSIKQYFYIICAIVVLNACTPAGGEFTGSEYMPDMAHSIAVEANVYTSYYYNTWDSASTISLKDLSNIRIPVAGTVPRGYAGIAMDGEHSSDVMDMLRGKDAVNSIAVPVNGQVPYYYEDTEEERTRAIGEIIDNPFPITADGLARGKELYDVFCGICHGEKGDGAGYLARDGGPYPVVPANFLLEEHVNSSNGRYYHAIMYGKNVMGAYKDKISYEERWQVIHYIRALQAKELKLAYDAENNTLNPAYGMPGANMKMAMAEEDHEEAGEHHGDEEHGEDHGESHDDDDHDGGH